MLKKDITFHQIEKYQEIREDITHNSTSDCQVRFRKFQRPAKLKIHQGSGLF